MPITIDLNKQAKSIASQPTNTPEGLKLAVFNNLAIAVNQLAEKSSLSYSLDAPTLQRVLNAYLEQNPTHNNPLNIVLHETKKQAEARFYGLNYRFEGMPAKPTFFNKHPEKPELQQQGVFEYIPELNRLSLLDGKIIHRNGEAQDGQFQYIPALKRMELVEGTKTAANGTTQQCRWAYRPGLDRMDTVQETGRRAFIPELGRDALVDGKITLGFGEVREGKFQYIPELKGTYLVDGKITFVTGSVAEGKRQYIPELKRMDLVDGKYTFPNGYVNEGKFQYIPKLNALYLVDGKKTYSNDHVEVGRWTYNATTKLMHFSPKTGSHAYIPELKREALVNGTLTHPDTKRVDTGRFEYIPSLNEMRLVEGSMYNAQGRLLKHGKWEYIPDLRGMGFMQGLSVSNDGTQQKGRRAYIAALRGVCLVEGSITRPNGTVQKGRWTFNPFTRSMDLEGPLPPSKLNNMVKNINQPVELLTSIFNLYDHNKVNQAAVSNLAHAAKQAIHAQTKPQFEAALAAYQQQVTTLSRALSLLTHPDKVDNPTPETSQALIKLNDIRKEIGNKISGWLLQWPSSSR